MKQTTMAALAALALLALVTTGCATAEMQRVRQMEISRVNLASARDGTFRGEYAYGNYRYAVSVTIVNHRIDGITVLGNRTTSHAKAAEGVIPRILAAQRNDVDAVSGATTTSKALLKAIEFALEESVGTR